MPIGCVYLRWFMALLSPTRNIRQCITISSKNRTKKKEKESEENRGQRVVRAAPNLRQIFSSLLFEVQASSNELKTRGYRIGSCAKLFGINAVQRTRTAPIFLMAKVKEKIGKDQAKGRTIARQKRENEDSKRLTAYARAFYQRIFMPFA